MPKAKFTIIRKCAICGQEFQAKNMDSIHCSRKCSNIAYNKKRKAKRDSLKREVIKSKVHDSREYLSVSEAVAIYGVTRDTLYKMMRKGSIDYINLGTRLSRINRAELESRFMKREEALEASAVKPKKTYSMEPEDCYTMKEIIEKYKASPSTVQDLIRRNSIPTRQIGKEVYAPKSEIDPLFT